MTVYAVYRAAIEKASVDDEHVSMAIKGEPEFFTSRDDAINYAQDEARGLLTNFFAVFSSRRGDSAELVGTAGWRPATYTIDFPGTMDYCVHLSERIQHELDKYAAEVATKEVV